MTSRWFATGIVAFGCAAAVSSSVTSFVPSHLRIQRLTPGAAQLRAYGSRTLAQRRDSTDAKFDAALADLTRHAAAANPAQLLADLHSLSPAARFKLAADGVTPLVAIDAVTTGDAQRLQAALESLGLERAAVYANDVGGWLPVASLLAASKRAELHSIRASLSRTRTGAVTTQGDFVQQSGALRTALGVNGTGVTVGVLSDSYDCYAVYAKAGSGVPVSGYAGYAYNGFTATAADDVSTGDLPSSVNVLAEADCLDYGAPLQPPFGDEGRAMLQIVHDVAPGASLAFYTAEQSEADFASGIKALAAAGATVIADDVGYFDEPFYQDGIVAQAVDSVQASGIAYFSAAGNDGNAAHGNGAYENVAPSFATLATSGANSGEYLLNVDTSGATVTTALPITVDALQPGELLAIVVEWDQPYVTGAATSGGATSSLDICVTGATNLYTIEDNDGNSVTCSGANATGADPVQILIIANPANASASTPKETLNLMVGLANGTAAPGRVKIAVQTDGQSDPPIAQFGTNSPTLQGHPGAAGAVTVGAAFYFNTPACATTPAELEAFSSDGGGPILFSSAGARLATSVVRQKPDVVGPDGGNDTFLGFTLASAGITGSNGELSTSISGCQNAPSFPNFFGTSAATPQVAGIAALLLQGNAALTPTQIGNALRDSALAMNGTAPNYAAGFGLVQAQGAMALLPPGAPVLSASATQVTVGTAVTLTWSSINATGCDATGGWSGAVAVSGSESVTPNTAGTASYSLSCSNAYGASAASSVSVTAAAARSASGGGGGSTQWSLLVCLMILGVVRYRQVLIANSRALHRRSRRAR